MYCSPRGSFGKEADAVSAVTVYAAQAAHFILPVIALIVLIRCVASMFYGRPTARSIPCCTGSV